MLGVFAGAGQALPFAIGPQRLAVGAGFRVIRQKTEKEQAAGRGDGMKRAGMNAERLGCATSASKGSPVVVIALRSPACRFR